MGLISKIQHYSTKDGPGIRSTVFCIGCNLRCSWCANPEAMLPGQKVLYHRQLCQRCGSCAAASNGSIILQEDGCLIDRERCENLTEMVDVCPFDAYELIGTEITPQALYRQLMKDEVFYRNSGGGVTFSGGECCLQPEFVLETTKLLKASGVHVALDTAGLWNFEKIFPLLDLADLILYDIKGVDPALHRRWTGADNSRILENAKKLSDMGKAMFIRLVMIPGVNDTQEELRDRFEFSMDLPSVQRIDVLPYHKLGEGKYRDLQIEYPADSIREYSPGELEAMIAPWTHGRIPVVVGA